MNLSKNNSLNFWKVSTYLLIFCVLSPIISLLWIAIKGDFSHWQDLLNYVIPSALKETIILVVGVIVLSAFLGIGSAWLTTAYDFPSRKFLIWALLLPLAIPTYIMAFAYLDLLHPLGFIQKIVRFALGYDSPRQFRLPDARSMLGAIILLSLALYPYVYLSVRVMFMSQALNLIEAARTLGCTRLQVFWRLIIPMARPAIVAGLSLVALETLNDIGASEFLGIKTLTVSIYTAWVSRSDLAAAAQIALFMLFIVSVIIYAENAFRNRQRYSNTQRLRPMQALPLNGKKALLVTFLAWQPLFWGFIVPGLYLLAETIKRLNLKVKISTNLWNSAFNTLSLSLVATFCTILVGTIIVWTTRHSPFKNNKLILRCASLGYALPGSVLAIALLIPLIAIDHNLSDFLQALFNLPPRLYLMGTISALVIAYCIRFLAIAIGALDSAYTRIPISLDYAAKTLGCTSEQTLFKIHLPLLTPALGSAALLIFVDAMKELSATLLLRPLNFETLATWLYAEAARGTYEEGAIAALLIVLAGLIPIIFLARTQFSASLDKS